ncbi:MAG: 16S rRNA (uracil(1498)-N(3))-methyltransferase [Verrucomicrobia bacterium]|nr:16S rRNA (uracil(1498)-N(3))-methyltransferase [Verrucomicrobiota bacterium]
MNLILLKKNELDNAGGLVLNDHRAEHIRNVLKSETGNELRVGILNGPKGTAIVNAMEKTAVLLQCTFDQDIPPRPSVDLLLALPRPKVMKRLWAQIAAMGVGRIILTNAWKVERNYFDTHVIETDFYNERLIEGLQQAGDTRLPEVTVHRQLKILIEEELDRLCPDSERVVAHPLPGEAHGAAPAGEKRLLLAVGPEGGWINRELELLESHGFRRIGIGERTLRTDTACIALLAVAQNAHRKSE